MAFSPWWANRDEVEIPLLFFSSPPAGRKWALRDAAEISL
jgi:hypothetical protein